FQAAPSRKARLSFISAAVKPFIKPRPATPPSPAPAAAPAPRISPNELTIFSVAAPLADPQERAAYLERACGVDADLRARLEERLQARDRLAAAAAAPNAAAPQVPA